MDKLITQAIAFLNELNGVIDQIQQKVRESDAYLSTQQPKMSELARIEQTLAEKQLQLDSVTSALASLTSAYNALREKLL